MASHLKNTTVTNFKPGLQASEQMPRKRKRHYNKMSLMLLMFVGCCLTLILNPLHVQAKENNNTTSKGENMLSNDHQNHQHEQGNTNIKADETNDNGAFKRLQQPIDINIEMNKPERDKEEEEEKELELEEDEHSTEVIEMIQPPHTLRHQEHYKQRMLQAEKHKQPQQHLNKNSNDGSDINDGVIDVEEQQQELNQYNRNLRYKQIQQVLREPLALPTPHHHRHEQHLQHLAKQRLAKQTELTWPQQHHLRHQHHQHIQEFPPQLRHLKHEMRKQNSTANKAKPQQHQRYFDRESSFMNPLTNMMTTEGPHLRHTGSNLNWKSITHANNPHNRLFNDDSNSNEKEEANEEEEDIKRFSLSLQATENEKANKGKETLHEHTGVDGSKGDNANYDTTDTGDNDNDDYSYEDDDDNDKEFNKQNNYPSITSSIKTNVKRYTNPLKPPLSSASSSYTFRKPHAGHHLKHTSPQNTDLFKSNSNKDNNNNKNDDDNDDSDDDDGDDDYDGIENNKDETDSSSDESSDDDNDDKISHEKWNKIEHEHYRKQLQHQRAMQALRYRRTQNNNTPYTATTSNKYSLYSPSSISASSTYNAGWTKRQTMNDGENDNIYSRYYVPGSVTRKKEEELGSPTAILESRRQFALQQRQNKALASAHHRRIVTEGSCRLPQPRVERIRKDSWKIYTPHCTILHRCADDAGCCPNERQTCAPKRTKNVDLFFFVISLNETQGSIEKLTFVNHTECHCIDRSKQRAPEYANSAAKNLLTNNNQIPYLRRATILNCYCPNLFEKILQEDGYCRCDCSSGNMGCDWLKRGMEHFSMNDRKCIIEGRCQLPTCEYGQYIKKHGRCPRREERHLSADMEW